MENLSKDLEAWPNDYQWDRAKGLDVTQFCVHYPKKTLQHPKADPDIRSCFEHQIAESQNQNRDVVNLDESGLAQCMSRRHDYSVSGKNMTGMANSGPVAKSLRRDCTGLGQCNIPQKKGLEKGG